MKIACIIHSLDGGGAERVMAALVSRLAIRGHDVTLITLGDARGDRHQVDASVTRRPLDVMQESTNLPEKLLHTRRRIRAVGEAIDSVGSDVVLSFCDRTNILVLWAAGGGNVPVVISERSDPAQQHLGSFWEYQRRRTYRRAAAAIALTDTSAVHLRSICPSPVIVIPSAVDVPPCQSDRSVALNNRRIVGVGRLEHEKGFDRLIEAFASIAEQSPGWSLRILGDGSLRQPLERLATELGVADRVSMPGWVRPVWDEIAAATIFALPSRYEGFPSALLEAMALGVPAVAVDCESGPRAILSDLSDGLLVGNTIGELAQGIQRLMEDPPLREKLGQNGKSVIQRFSWDAMVDAYERVLIEAVENSPRSHNRSGSTGGASS